MKADWMDKDMSTLTDTEGNWKITIKTPSAGAPTIFISKATMR